MGSPARRQRAPALRSVPDFLEVAPPPRNFAAAGELIRCLHGLRLVERIRVAPYQHTYHLWEPTVSPASYTLTRVIDGEAHGRADTRLPALEVDFLGHVEWQMGQHRRAVSTIVATCPELQAPLDGRINYYPTQGGALFVGNPADAAARAATSRKEARHG